MVVTLVSLPSCKSIKTVIPMAECSTVMEDVKLDTLIDIEEMQYSEWVIGLTFHVFTHDEIKINFDSLDIAIDSSVTYTNNILQGVVKFERDPLVYVYDIDYYDIGNFAQDVNLQKEHCDVLDESYRVNVYVIPDNGSLLGFTREPLTFVRMEEDGELNRIFLSHNALYKGSTLAHEIGHYLGLGHRFGDCNNIMSYNDCRNRLDANQINSVMQFIYQYRQYILK